MGIYSLTPNRILGAYSVYFYNELSSHRLLNKVPRFIARTSASVPSHRSQSSAAFITIIEEPNLLIVRTHKCLSLKIGDLDS
jgi:hypothetical protein